MKTLIERIAELIGTCFSPGSYLRWRRCCKPVTHLAEKSSVAVMGVDFPSCKVMLNGAVSNEEAIAIIEKRLHGDQPTVGSRAGDAPQTIQNGII